MLSGCPSCSVAVRGLWGYRWGYRRRTLGVPAERYPQGTPKTPPRRPMGARAMPQNLLTDAKVRNAKPLAKSFKLADGGGLFLLVRPNRAKLWRWKFRLAGKEGLFAVGVFPALGLADARHARDAARALVAKGISPAHQRDQERRTNIADAEERRREADGAFGKVADAWLEDGKAIWA